MRVNRWLAMAGVTAALGLGVNSGLAQNNGGGPGGGGGGWRNLSPEERQQRMMGMIKDQLEITDDAEWKAIQPMVQKVMDARMATMGGMGRGMFGRPRGGGGNGGDNTQADQGGQRRGGFMGQQPSPEAEALQKAVDSKASKAEIKAALAKYNETHKAKQADLEKAQAELRKVLTARQEAIATLNGWL
jgi:hypothetical protein